jgi:DNA repair exonuclease SbcCD ATPase subunit
MKAKCFLSIGKKGIHIDFDKLGEIVLIKGKNYDVSPESSNGAGKCFGPLVPILMFDGTIKNAKDIKIGDTLMGDDSTPRIVLKTHSGRMPMYDIIPKKGDKYTVNEEHILVLKSSDKKYNRMKNNKYHVGDNIFHISVKDYLKQNKSFKHLMHGFRASVDFSCKPVMIDPYFLGVWLGDGTKCQPQITNVNSEVIDAIYSEAESRKLKVRKNHITYSLNSFKDQPGDDALWIYNLHKNGLNYEKICEIIKGKLPQYEGGNVPNRSVIYKWIKEVRDWVESGGIVPTDLEQDIKIENTTNKIKRNSLLNDLNNYNLINNKHVPFDYKTNSREVRLQILAGLIDTDGEYDKAGFYFTNKNKILAEDVLFLARSLGFSSYIRKVKKQCVNNGVWGIYYRVSIFGDCDSIPVKIEYKKSAPRRINKDPLVVGIKIESVGEGDYYGFETDGNHRFLLGDFTVVHNSTCLEILVYGLFGKLIKGLPHKEALNKKLKKGLEIEICFELNGSEYKVVRTRKPDSLHLFKDGKEDTVGGMVDTQNIIENLIKMNYEAFINITCFGEHNNHAFLACDAASKRVIVENLLGLEKYLKYCKSAKELLKETETKLSVSKKNYENFDNQIDNCIKRLGQLSVKKKEWVTAKEKEITQLESSLASKKAALLVTDDGQASLQYTLAQDRIKLNKDEIVKLEEQKTKLSPMIEQLNSKLESHKSLKDSLSLELHSKETDILLKQKEANVLQSQIKSLEKLQPGIKCSACFGTVDSSNYQHLIDHNSSCYKELQSAIGLLNSLKKELLDKVEVQVTEMKKLTTLKKQVEEKNTALSLKITNSLTSIQKDSQIKEPNIGSKEILLNEQINEISKRIESKKYELDYQDPYVEIINQTLQEKASLEASFGECKIAISSMESLVPYYEFWIDGFGDDGIRAYVIDGMLPALNSRINYWLQFLIDNKITLKFDNKFDVIIERNPPDGDPFVYNATSGGERRRINLAISQAFAHVMMLSAGTCPSVISLDEVALNVDLPGIHGIYKMICELSKERQVLVTTHDSNLTELLNSCNVLTVVKKDGFTEIEA